MPQRGSQRQQSPLSAADEARRRQFLEGQNKQALELARAGVTPEQLEAFRRGESITFETPLTAQQQQALANAGLFDAAGGGSLNAGQSRTLQQLEKFREGDAYDVAAALKAGVVGQSQLVDLGFDASEIGEALDTSDAIQRRETALNVLRARGVLGNDGIVDVTSAIQQRLDNVLADAGVDGGDLLEARLRIDEANEANRAIERQELAQRQALVDYSSTRREIELSPARSIRQDDALNRLAQTGHAQVEGDSVSVNLVEALEAGHGDLLIRAGFSVQEVQQARADQQQAQLEAALGVVDQVQFQRDALQELANAGAVDVETGGVLVGFALERGIPDQTLIDAGIAPEAVEHARNTPPPSSDPELAELRRRATEDVEQVLAGVLARKPDYAPGELAHTYSIAREATARQQLDDLASGSLQPANDAQLELVRRGYMLGAGVDFLGAIADNRDNANLLREGGVSQEYLDAALEVDDLGALTRDGFSPLVAIQEGVDDNTLTTLGYTPGQVAELRGAATGIVSGPLLRPELGAVGEGFGMGLSGAGPAGAATGLALGGLDAAGRAVTELEAAGERLVFGDGPAKSFDEILATEATLLSFYQKESAILGPSVDDGSDRFTEVRDIIQQASTGQLSTEEAYKQLDAMGVQVVAPIGSLSSSFEDRSMEDQLTRGFVVPLAAGAALSGPTIGRGLVGLVKVGLRGPASPVSYSLTPSLSAVRITPGFGGEGTVLAGGIAPPIRFTLSPAVLRDLEASIARSEGRAANLPRVSEGGLIGRQPSPELPGAIKLPERGTSTRAPLTPEQRLWPPGDPRWRTLGRMNTEGTTTTTTPTRPMPLVDPRILPFILPFFPERDLPDPLRPREPGQEPTVFPDDIDPNIRHVLPFVPRRFLTLLPQDIDPALAEITKQQIEAETLPLELTEADGQQLARPRTTTRVGTEGASTTTIQPLIEPETVRGPVTDAFTPIDPDEDSETQPKPVVFPVTTTQTQTRTRTDVQPQLQPDTQPATRPDPARQTRPEPRPEPRPAVSPFPFPQPEPLPQVRTEPAVQPQPEPVNSFPVLPEPLLLRLTRPAARTTRTSRGRGLPRPFPFPGGEEDEGAGELFPDAASWQSGFTNTVIDFDSGQRSDEHRPKAVNRKPGETYRVLAYDDDPPEVVQFRRGIMDITAFSWGLKFTPNELAAQNRHRKSRNGIRGRKL